MTERALWAAFGAVIGLSGCGEPAACRADAECPSDSTCDLDRRVCVQVSASAEGGGEGGCVVQTERCDGRDNDCDGDIDERADLEARAIVGQRCGDPEDVCGAGHVACVDGGLTCLVAVSSADERCNGADDDCDGATDESFDLGRRCDAGRGECRREAETVCDEGGAGVRCSAVPSAPEGEICDALDNDCDGEVDEDLGRGEECHLGLGECERSGQVVCESGGRLGCDAPVVEGSRRDLCDGRDEDCDGATDEGYDVGAPCWVGDGECRRGGEIRCVRSGEAACDARPGLARVERCDSLDDDCDGATDEAFDAGEICAQGLGRCRSEGIWVCREDGADQVCTAQAMVDLVEDESCNSVDDDCDGDVDEDFDVGAPCGVGIGACRREGLRVCGDGAFTVCPVQPGLPNPVEMCDGADDDCDASIDEGFGLGEFCRVGQGACVALGENVCSLDRQGVACSVEPEPARPEICNDVDDDCDGVTDEPAETLRVDLAGRIGDAQLLERDDGGGMVAARAGDELQALSYDCAWSVAWRVGLDVGAGDEASLHAVAAAAEGGLAVLVGGETHTLRALDEDGERWSVALGPAEEVGGLVSAGAGFAVVVRDEVQVLDSEGGLAARWGHGAPEVPTLNPGPEGDLLLAWTAPGSGDGVVRRVTRAGGEVWTVVVDGGGAVLQPSVQAVGPGGSTVVMGRLVNEAGSASWLGVVDSAGVLQVDRGSPFYDGCVTAVFAPDASAPVLRCVAPYRLLLIDVAGDVVRSTHAVTAAMSPDPSAAPDVVLVAESDAEGITLRRIALR